MPITPKRSPRNLNLPVGSQIITEPGDFPSILDTVGHTPLVELRRVLPRNSARLVEMRVL